MLSRDPCRENGTAPESPGGDGRQRRGGTERPRAHGTDTAWHGGGGGRKVLTRFPAHDTDPRAPEPAVQLLPVERTRVCAADAAADTLTHIPGGRALAGGRSGCGVWPPLGAHFRRWTERAGGARTHHVSDPLQLCSSVRLQSVPLRAHGYPSLPERSLCRPPLQGASVGLPRRARPFGVARISFSDGIRLSLPLCAPSPPGAASSQPDVKPRTAGT